MSGNPIPAVSIANLLSERLIRTRLAQQEKGELMNYLVCELCAVKSFPDPAGMLDQMLKREQGINTTLDTGLSLPHARIDGLSEVAAILGLPTRPISDAKFAQAPIRAMFLFISPNRPEAYSQQLQLLRSIALLFDDAFIGRLHSSETPEQALDMIREKEQRQKSDGRSS